MSFAAEFVPPGASEVASKQEVREGDYVISITSRDVETVGRVEKCEKARVRIAGDPTLTGSASSGWQDRSSIRRKLTAEERGRQEEKEEAHKASLAVARKSDLSDLRGEVDGHFEIPEPADRGMIRPDDCRIDYQHYVGAVNSAKMTLEKTNCEKTA